MSWEYVQKGRGGASLASHAPVRVGLRFVKGSGGSLWMLTVAAKVATVAERGLKAPLMVRVAVGSGEHAGKLRLELGERGDYVFRTGDKKSQSYTLSMSAAAVASIRRRLNFPPAAAEHAWDVNDLIVTLPAALLEPTPGFNIAGGLHAGRAAASPSPSRPDAAPPAQARAAPAEQPKAGDRRTPTITPTATPQDEEAAIQRHLATKGVTLCPTVALNPVAGGIAVSEADRAVIRRHDADQEMVNKPYHARHSMAAKAARARAGAAKP